MFDHKPAAFLPIEINTIDDFFKDGGPMLISGALQVRGHIRDLMKSALEHKLVVLSVVDLHQPADPEFAQQGLPPHALDRSPGRTKISETFVRGVPVFPPSGQRRPWPKLNEHRATGGQLVIEKTQFDLFSNPATKELLRSFAPEELVFFGATLEHDIFHTAITARSLGHSVTVAEDACGIHAAAAASQARAAMLARGVHFVHTEEIASRIGYWARREQQKNAAKASEVKRKT